MSTSHVIILICQLHYVDFFRSLCRLVSIILTYCPSSLDKLESICLTRAKQRRLFEIAVKDMIGLRNVFMRTIEATAEMHSDVSFIKFCKIKGIPKKVLDFCRTFFIIKQFFFLDVATPS